jgi:hypothetical protein
MWYYLSKKLTVEPRVKSVCVLSPALTGPL